MNRPRNEFLASATLARDKNGRVLRRHLCDLRKDGNRSFRRAHDFLKYRGGWDFGPQRFVSLAKNTAIRQKQLIYQQRNPSSGRGEKRTSSGE